jgi:hypothetical protein
MLPRALTFSAGVAAGAAVVALSWWLIGGGGSSSDLLQGDPGIPPPEYAYLDNARVLAYLAQIEGGLSTSEKVTEQLSRTRNAGVAASGIQAGASSAEQQFVERVVTPTATTRFYRLLDRLEAKGYLRTTDYGANGIPSRKLREVTEGDFVLIRGCRLRLPTYAQMDELIQQSTSAPIPTDVAAYDVLQRSATAERARLYAQIQAYPSSGISTSRPRIAEGATRRRLVRAGARFAKALGRNPRIPVSSCTGRRVRRPHGVDLLFPLPLGLVNFEPGLLEGRVTVVGKLLRILREGDLYIDTATLKELDGPVRAVDGTRGFPHAIDLSGELDADVTVFGPGAVILPIAIYK